MWTHRIMLEAMQHPDNCFLTLTYTDETLPVSIGSNTGLTSATLKPKDLQDWLKRFRKAISPLKIRYYAVGEYGDESFRPHYHAALFGYPSCRRNETSSHRNDPTGRPTCCANCLLVFDTWGRGRIFLGSLETHSAQYICGYVTKKMTAPDDPRLRGLHPEFCRMSLRPGIGLNAMHDVASTLLQFNLEQSQTDVPVSLRHGTRMLPLGRYLRRKLRLMTGKEENAPQQVIDALAEEVRPLREAAFKTSTSFKKILVESSDGKVAQIEAKQRIFKQRKTL